MIERPPTFTRHTQPIDCTRLVDPELAAWPGLDSPRLKWDLHLDRGDPCTAGRIEMSLHTGTHVDAPSHFIAGGGGVDTLDLSGLIGWARVVHVPEDHHVVSRHVVLELPEVDDAAILLFRTDNSTRLTKGFDEDFVALSYEAAVEISERGYRGVGIDYLSIEPFHSAGPQVHLRLLETGIVIIEGLDLAGTSPGIGWFTCLPLAIVGADAAPARAMFWPMPAE